jgi:hypothetical protein
VDQVQVNEKKVGLGIGSFAFTLAHNVRVPDLLGQCLSHGLAPFTAVGWFTSTELFFIH